MAVAYPIHVEMSTYFRRNAKPRLGGPLTYGKIGQATLAMSPDRNMAAYVSLSGVAVRFGATKITGSRCVTGVLGDCWGKIDPEHLGNIEVCVLA